MKASANNRWIPGRSDPVMFFWGQLENDDWSAFGGLARQLTEGMEMLTFFSKPDYLGIFLCFFFSVEGRRRGTG